MPYFPAFRDRGPRVPGHRSCGTASGWLCFLSLVTSFVFFIWLRTTGTGEEDGGEPDLPEPPSPGSLRVATGLRRLGGGPSKGVGLGLLGPVLASPIRHSLHPGEHATEPSGPFLPSSPCSTTSPSSPIPGERNDPTEEHRGERPRRPLADANACYLYFLDDGAYGREGGIRPTWILAARREPGANRGPSPQSPFAGWVRYSRRAGGRRGERGLRGG